MMKVRRREFLDAIRYDGQNLEEVRAFFAERLARYDEKLEINRQHFSGALEISHPRLHDVGEPWELEIGETVVWQGGIDYLLLDAEDFAYNFEVPGEPPPTFTLTLANRHDSQKFREGETITVEDVNHEAGYLTLRRAP